MNKVALVFLLLVGAAHAERIEVYTYSAQKIYPVHTAVGLATQIVFPTNEKIQDYGTGHSAGWELVRRDHVLYLKPKNQQAATNLYVRSDKRSYLFDLRVVAGHWQRLSQAQQAGVHYRVQFAPDEKETLLPAQSQRHENYTFAAAPEARWLVPAAVYDDGHKTYVQWPQQAASQRGVPAFYGKKSEDGEEFLVNVYHQPQQTTVMGVYPYLVLRHGDSVVGLRREGI